MCCYGKIGLLLKYNDVANINKATFCWDIKILLNYKGIIFLFIIIENNF